MQAARTAISNVRVKVPGTTKSFTGDSFQNVAANLGLQTNNLSSGSYYGLNPISRNHVLLEMMYRGSWLIRRGVDCVADDMTRAGIDIKSDMPPENTDALHDMWRTLGIWRNLNLTIKWARLYGGCLAVPMIEGQNISTPLDVNRIPRGSFKGLLVLDRWMVWPHVEDLVDDFGPDFGRPRYYSVVTADRSIPRVKIHHSRCIRIDGDDLPYWQRLYENEWALSVVEPVYDRMVAFDSVTQGAAQLAYKAHLRVVAIEGYRDLVGAGGPLYQAFLESMRLLRLFQSNEGMSVIDAKDRFETHQNTTFTGMAELLVHFGQQLSGAWGIPLVRLFGQSPTGLNSTGESDLANYYDGINSQQNDRLTNPVTRLLEISHQSRFGQPLPDGVVVTFKPLWQIKAQDKATIAQTVTNAVMAAAGQGILKPSTAAKELRQSSETTGVFSNITDDDIAELEEAEAAPPAPADVIAEIAGAAPEAGEGIGEESGEAEAMPAEESPRKTMARRPLREPTEEELANAVG